MTIRYYFKFLFQLQKIGLSQTIANIQLFLWQLLKYTCWPMFSVKLPPTAFQLKKSLLVSLVIPLKTV